MFCAVQCTFASLLLLQGILKRESEEEETQSEQHKNSIQMHE